MSPRAAGGGWAGTWGREELRPGGRTPGSQRATQGAAGPWPGHLCLSLLCGSRRHRRMLHRCRAQWLRIQDSGCPERGKPGVTATLDNNLLCVAGLKVGQASLLPLLPYGSGLLPSPFFQMRKLRERMRSHDCMLVEMLKSGLGERAQFGR